MKATLSFCVIGAGSWGTALAIHLACSGYETALWTQNLDHRKEMDEAKKNQRYLPDLPFPEKLYIAYDLDRAVMNSQIILIAVPSHAFQDTLKKIKPLISPSHSLLSATKGLNEDGGFLSETAHKILPNIKYALLSGPSFAKEVAKQLPTTVIISSENQAYAEELAQALSKQVFRAYTNNDLIGVQIGGAVKNVLAVAVGISDGLGFGANARAALITRGLEEMKRLGLAAGAELKTIMGLSGLGDLVLTCTDNQSRNRRFGLAIGQGKSLILAQNEIGQVVESIHTSILIQKRIQEYQLELPIIEQVYHILHSHLPAKDAVINLFSRRLKSE